jgi:hypothetical protein
VNGPSPLSDWLEEPTCPPDMLEAGKLPLLFGPDLAKPLPDLEYIVAELGMVAGGGAPHLVAGYGFSGKTIALQSMLLSLAAEKPVWGAHKAARRRVLHVDCEQGERLTVRRYQRLAAAMGIQLGDLGDTLALSVMPPLLLNNDGLSQWRDLMAGRDVMLVDSLRAASSGMDENDSRIRGCLDLLGRLAEETKCRGILVHHARKMTADDPGGKYAIRGSGAIFDGSDAILLFSAAKGEPVQVEQPRARSHGENIDDFALVISDVAGDGDDPRWGLRVQVHGKELVEEKRQAAKDARLAAEAQRNGERMRIELRGGPRGTRELRGILRLSGDQYESALKYLGSSIDVRYERNGTGRTAKMHYLNGSQHEKVE